MLEQLSKKKVLSSEQPPTEKERIAALETENAELRNSISALDGALWDLILNNT